MITQPPDLSPAIEERRWSERLRAMRRLPPGTRLPQPDDPDERRLLAELLSLPDDVAPLPWLLVERGRAMALIALRRALRGIGQSAVALRRNTALGWARADEGGYLRPLSRIESLVRLAGDPAPSEERLRETLAALRAEAPPLPADEGWLDFLSDLLQLPAGADPLRWIAAERGEIAARVALQAMLQAVHSSTWEPSGPPAALHRPRQALRLPGGQRVTVDGLALGADGFTLDTRLRFRAGDPPPGAAGWRLPAWAGFDRVVDDLGYHYMVAQISTGGGPHLRWWYRQRLRVICRPAVAAEATTLTFSALPAALIYRRPQPTGPPMPLVDESLGDLHWRIPLPTHRKSDDRIGRS